jgi:type IV secretion system protein VirB2
MELHIAEVFPGDPDGQTAANLESRQMISDVLRRGLDVSVREPTPVRQIEPVQPLNWKGELHENAFDCLRHTARQILTDPRAPDHRPCRCARSVSLAQPALADGTSIETGLSTIKSWMTTVASVVGIIAIMAVGYAKLTGRMDWGKAVTVLIGIGIIFSATTIVGWMGGRAAKMDKIAEDKVFLALTRPSVFMGLPLEAILPIIMVCMVFWG